MERGYTSTGLVEKVIFIFFFVSGACGLVYEVLWGKYLSLFIGSSTYAHMIVLATFMGGLAAGSYVFGRMADKSSNPLKLYGWLEIGIGFYGALYPHILENLKEIYFYIASNFQFGGVMNVLYKLPLSFLTIIFPTFLMGGTLPVLSKYLVRSLGKVGKSMSILYFINSFGAVFGTLVAGFFVIEHLGLKVGIIATGLINLIIGLGILVFEMVAKNDSGGESPRAAGEEVVAIYEARLVKLATACIFLSGFTSMVYELTWTRLFAVVLGSSTYSFSLMLAAFITGITYGSLLVSRIVGRTRNFLLLFGLCEFAIAIAIIAGLPFYERLPYYFWKLRYLFRPIPETFVYYHAVKFALCFAIMFVPTLFFGMTLPLVSKIVSDDLNKLGRKIGDIYAVNTVGTLLGALFTGLLFIPIFGLKRSLEIGIVLNMVIATIILLRSPEWGASRLRFATAFIGLLVLGGYFAFVPEWNKLTFAADYFRQRGAPPSTYQEFKAFMESLRIKYYKEDVHCNVAVLETKLGDGAYNLSLTVNGKPDASSYWDMPTQVLLGQLPLLFKPQADDVMVIGLGSGVTSGTVLSHPIKQLDCIEISPSVVEAVNHFSPFNNDVVKNPRLKVILEDAKTYLKITRKKYDVIISEPSNPWVAGVGNLFSVEFFEAVAQRLKPDGIMVQWFHNYEMANDILAMIVKTFNTVFPNIYIFQGGNRDCIMLGSLTPINPDFKSMNEKLSSPAVKRELEKAGVNDLVVVLALQALSPGKVHEITMGSEVHRDSLPLLEHRAPRAFYLEQFTNLIDKSDGRFRPDENLFISRYMREQELTPENYKNLLRFFQDRRSRNDKLAYSISEKYARIRPEDPTVLMQFANQSFSHGKEDTALALVQHSMNQANTIEVMEKYADFKFGYQIPLNSIFNPRDFTDTAGYLRRCLAASDKKDKYLIKLGQAFFAMGSYSAALEPLLQAEHFRELNSKEKHFAPIPDEALYLMIGKTYYHLSDYEKAQEYLRRSLAANPKNPEAAYYLLVILDLQKKAVKNQAALLKDEKG